MRSKNIMLVTVFAALYVVIGMAIPAISFGAIQCRVQDALYPLITLFGIPSVIGLTIGHFIYNFYGFTLGVALGPLDVIISPLLFILPKIAIHKLGLRGVIIHIIFIALWVAYLLHSLFGLPYLATVITVGIGEFVAEVVLGIPLTRLIERRI
tara:strand:- start:669 stop:1127 length:459 start_codon:yes stop_codon:yes gene_type:complete